MRYAQLVVMLVWLGGCAIASPSLTVPATPPAPVAALALVPASIRSAPPGDLSLAEAAAGSGVRRGAVVRWGGSILALQNEVGWTRLEIQQHPLDQNGQPQPDSGSAGRFYARAAIPFDSQVYAPGRQITVAGVLTGTTAGGAAGPASSLPVVEAKEFYLWGSTVAQSDEALFRPHQQRNDHSFSLLDFFSRLPFNFGLGFGYWNGWHGYYPGYGAGWRGYYTRYWNGWGGYYPGYWWPGSGIYFGISR